MRTFTRIAIALAATAGLVGATLPATASSAATPQWTDLKEAPAPVSNPMKGFMPWAPEDGSAPGTVANALPYTLEWAPFPVKDVVTGRDTYDFTKVDALLDAIASRGHQAVIRFSLDTPGKETGMPQYLIDAGTDTSRTYDFYDNKKISFSPNYNDPKVQEMLLHFVTALGDKYDGDPRISYITAGLYGFWGEEHTYPYNGYVNDQNPKAINWMPSDEFRARLVEAWDEAFDDTFVQNRYPTAWGTSMTPSATRPWRAPTGISSPNSRTRVRGMPGTTPPSAESSTLPSRNVLSLSRCAARAWRRDAITRPSSRSRRLTRHGSSTSTRSRLATPALS